MKLVYGLIGAAAVILLILSVATATPHDDFEVKLLEGVVPAISAEQAAEMASTQLTQMATRAGVQVTPNVLTVTAVPAGRADLAEAGRGGQPGENEMKALAGRTWWIVRAEGAFVPQHPAPGSERTVFNSGYIIVDATTGEIWGMGTP